MTKTDMLDEIFDNLKDEIFADVAQADILSETLLKRKIKGAYRDVQKARHYPKSYSEAQIEEDMQDFYSNIQDIARYDYSSVGAENLSSYSADGSSLHYKDRDKLFYGVYPIAR